MILNHVESDVTARYDKYDGLAEKRQAMEIWGRRLEDIVEGAPATDNVVELARGLYARRVV